MTDPGGSFLDRARIAKPAPAPRPNVGGPILAGGATTAYGLAGLEANIADLQGRTEGSRNHALNTAAFNLGQLVAGGELDGAAAQAALWSTARLIGLDESEIGPTIASGMADGATTPRTAPPLPDYALTPFTPPTPPTGPQPGHVTTGDPDPMHALRVAAELNALRVRHDAKEAFKAEQAALTFRPPIYTATLTEELAIPDNPIRYAIDQLLPHGGNALLTAQFKAGKTTLLNDLARCFADGDRFLGRYDVDTAPGRIAILNYEVGADQFRHWLREVGIINTDRVTVLNLRGYRLPITAPIVEDWIVNYLATHDVGTVIADPFARAATGTDENSNSEVGVWLDTLDVIKSRAGVRDLVLATHTGRGEMEKGSERARGATRLDDWADVRWILTKDKDSVRWFRASGRDVETDERSMVYDEATRHVILGDERTKDEVGKGTIADQLLEWIRERPGVITRDIEADGPGGQKERMTALNNLRVSGAVEVVTGANGRKEHHAANHAFTGPSAW